MWSRLLAEHFWPNLLVRRSPFFTVLARISQRWSPATIVMGVRLSFARLHLRTVSLTLLPRSLLLMHATGVYSAWLCFALADTSPRDRSAFWSPCRCRLRSRDRSFGPYSVGGALSFSTHSMKGASRREPLLPDPSLWPCFPEFSTAKMAQLSWSEEHGIPELPQSRATWLGTARHASQ